MLFKRYINIVIIIIIEALIWKVVNWPLSSSAPLVPVANPCRSLYIAQNMASEGVSQTPSDAILWAIYNDLQGFDTRGAELESGKLTTFQLTTFQFSASSGKHMQISVYRSQNSVRRGVSYPFGRHFVSDIHWYSAPLVADQCISLTKWRPFCERYGMRPLFSLPSLIAVVDQYPEIPSHNIGHSRSTKKTRFSCKWNSLFIFSNSKAFIVSADIKFDLVLVYFAAFLNRKNVRKNRDIYAEPANFQEKLVHIMLKLASLEIKAVNLYLDSLFLMFLGWLKTLLADVWFAKNTKRYREVYK